MTVLAQRPAAPTARRAPSQTAVLRALVAQGLRDERRGPLLWGGPLGVMGGLMAAIWPSIEDSTAELVRGYPEAIREAFGIRGLDTVEQYVDVEMLSFVVPLAAITFAVRCATRGTVGAEDRGRLDTLLALPVSRRALAAGWFAVAGLLLAAVLAVAGTLTWGGGTLAGTGISATSLLAGFGNVWPLAMAFAGLAVLVAGVAHSSGLVTGAAIGTAVAMYLLDVVGRLAPGLETARAISAFRYYGSAVQDGFDPAHAAGLTAAGLVLAAAGALLFERRDVA